MNKDEIIGKVKELFGAELTTVNMASVEATLLQPVTFDIEDGAEMVDGLEVSLEDGSYSLEDGTTFNVSGGVIADLIEGEVVVEGEEEEVIEEELSNTEMSTESTEVEETEEENKADVMLAELEALKLELETMKTEKVEMSAKIVELSNEPAEEEVKIKKSIYSKEGKNDRLMAIRNAMKN